MKLPISARTSLIPRLGPVQLANLAVSLLVCLMVGCGQKKTSNVSIVAAENFYGGVARQIAGNSADVTSILSNPNQDPHEFTTDAATAMAVADADIVIYNGIGYDDWMDKLLGVQGKPGRIVIRVADLIGAKAGDNPHIWYDPAHDARVGGKACGNFEATGEPRGFSKGDGCGHVENC